jgi:hypothetical protein
MCEHSNIVDNLDHDVLLRHESAEMLLGISEKNCRTRKMKNIIYHHFVTSTIKYLKVPLFIGIS